MKRLTILLGMLVVLWGGSAWAAGTCGTSGKTGTSPYTVTANTAEHVTACIAAVEIGATIQLRAGTTDWSAGGVIINRAVTIMGAGNSSCPTACDDATVFTGTPQMFRITTSNVRLSGITLDSVEGGYGSVQIYLKGTSITNWRVDHMHFKNFLARAITVGSYAALSDNPVTRAHPGLIDSNRFYKPTRGKAIEMYGHTEGYPANPYGTWSEPLVFGGSDFVFVEDNVFVATTSMPDGVAGTDSDTNGKFVFRFNSFTNFDVYTHGVESCTNITGVCVYRSTRGWEIYKNTFDFTLTHGYSLNLRGGTGYIWGNTFTGTNPSYGSRIRYLNQRGDVTGTCLEPMACQGSNPADGNQSGKYGYVCYQQLGTTGTNGITPLPIRHWLNSNNGATTESAMTGASFLPACNFKHVEVGRDILVTERSGVGTALPGTCTTNDAFWKTNEGFWNSKTPGVAAGALYKCAAGNTWVPFYVPYLYPHPLRSGLSAPTGVTVK